MTGEQPGIPTLAYVGLDRQLHAVHPDGGGRRQVSFPQVTSALMRWGGSAGRDACAWPTWSPDGEWLACFRSTRSADEAPDVRVGILQANGPEAVQLGRIEDGLPLYACWSPDGAALALLIQSGEQLELRVVRRDRPGEHRLVEEGPPLFFDWLPKGHGMVVHAGSPSGNRLVIRDPLGQAEDIPLPGAPGTFCAPMVIGDRIVYAARRGDGSSVVSVSLQGADPVELFRGKGLLAFVPSPDGASLAVSSATAANGPYEGVTSVRLDGTGVPKPVAAEPCMAFFWLPDGQGVVTVGPDPERKCLWWNLHLIESGDQRVIGPFRPTRELMFHLHFFEQFVRSHPLVSPNGRWLAYPTFEGALDGPDAAPGTPRIEVVDLSDPKGRPVAVAAGRYCAFAPGFGTQPSTPNEDHDAAV